MKAIVAATELRRHHIPCETFLQGSTKSQMKKIGNYEAVVFLDDGIVRDMILGGRIGIGDSLLDAVKTALDGIEQEKS